MNRKSMLMIVIATVWLAALGGLTVLRTTKTP